MSINRIRSLLITVLMSGLSLYPAWIHAAGISDGEIIAIYNQVNTFDIESAGIALKCSQSDEVISLAKMVQNDHTGVRQMAADLAKEMRLDKSLPDGRENATVEHANTLKKLNEKCNDGFDKSYLEHEIKFHTAAISAVTNILIPAANSEKVKQLMIKILPGFEHHLAETKRVYASL